MKSVCLLTIFAAMLATGCASPQHAYLVDERSGDMFGPLPKNPGDNIWINGLVLVAQIPNPSRLAVQEKLHRAIIPELDFTNTPVRQVLATLEKASGVPFILDFSDSILQGNSADPFNSGNKKAITITFSARYISAWAALRVIPQLGYPFDWRYHNL